MTICNCTYYNEAYNHVKNIKVWQVFTEDFNQFYFGDHENSFGIF